MMLSPFFPPPVLAVVRLRFGAFRDSLQGAEGSDFLVAFRDLLLPPPEGPSIIKKMKRRLELI